jgi:hypothetical protein
MQVCVTEILDIFNYIFNWVSHQTAAETNHYYQQYKNSKENLLAIRSG